MRNVMWVGGDITGIGKIPMLGVKKKVKPSEPSDPSTPSTSEIFNLFANNEQGFWYDPNDLSTMFQDYLGTVRVTEVGQPVGLIRDKSGNNNHAYQNISASRPILRQNATTGAYYLEFDGSDDFLVTNSIDFTVTDKVSLFAGLRKMSDSSYGVLCELSSSWVKNTRSFVVTAPSGNNFPLYSSASRLSYPFNSGQQATSTSNFPAPISNVITAKHSTTTELWINGALNSTVNGGKGTGNYGNYPLYIGRRAGTTFPFIGHLYGLIGIGRLTTGDETKAIETELAERVGVTLSV